MLSLSRVAASSRLMPYSDAVRRSRAPATRVCWRTRAISVAMTSATVSMTPNVSRYCTSDTAKVNRGGTKKKSKQTTFRTAVSTDGSRPMRKPAMTTPSKYTMTRFDSSTYGNMPNATAVQAAEIAAAAT